LYVKRVFSKIIRISLRSQNILDSILVVLLPVQCQILKPLHKDKE